MTDVSPARTLAQVLLALAVAVAPTASGLVSPMAPGESVVTDTSGAAAEFAATLAPAFFNPEREGLNFTFTLSWSADRVPYAVLVDAPRDLRLFPAPGGFVEPDAVAPPPLAVAVAPDSCVDDHVVACVLSACASVGNAAAQCVLSALAASVAGDLAMDPASQFGQETPPGWVLVPIPYYVGSGSHDTVLLVPVDAAAAADGLDFRLNVTDASDAGDNEEQEWFVSIYEAQTNAGGAVSWNTGLTSTGDATPPDVALDPLDAVIHGDAGRIAFTAADLNLVTVTCALSTGPWADCLDLTSHDFGLLAEGSYVAYVNATDAADNSASASVAFDVDETPPLIIVHNHSEGAFIDGPDIEFNFTVVDAHPAGATCAFGEQVVDDCASNVTFRGLSDGLAVLVIRAVDALGHDDELTLNVTIDLAPPQVSMSFPENDAVMDASSITPILVVEEANGFTVACSLDGDEFGDCVDLPLPEGPVTLVARATDAAGKQDTATAGFVVDRTSPELAVTAPAVGSFVATRDVAVDLDASDANLASVTCELDGGAAADCASGHSFADVADGAHTLRLVATDAAGHTTELIVPFTVDTVAPVVTIDAPAVDSFLASGDGTAAFGITEIHPDVVTCSIDGAEPEACDSASAHAFADLADGAHTLNVTATDKAGNEHSVDVAFNVDSTLPDLDVTTPAADAFLATSDVSVAFTATDANVDSVTCRLDGGAEEDCAGGSHSFAGVPDGAHSVTVTVEDAAGHRTARTVAFTVDTVAPVAGFALADGAHVAAASGTLGVDASDANLASVTCVIDDGSAVDCASGLDYSGLADGSHSATVTATDLAGNEASESIGFTVDSVDPVVSISSPADDAYVAASTVSSAFTATDTNLASVTCAVDGGAPYACASGDALGGLAEGAHVLVVSATDAAGRVGDASVSFTVDLTPPAVVVASPAAGAALPVGRVEVSVDAVDANLASVTCAVDDGAAADCVSGVAFEDLADGAHALTVLATDRAGQSTEVVVSFTVDTVAPAAPALALKDVTSADHAFTNDPVVALAVGSTDDATAWLVSLEADAPAADDPRWSSAPLATVDVGAGDGARTLHAWARDAAGNVGPAVSASITLDTAVATPAFTVPRFVPSSSVPLSLSGLDGDVVAVLVREIAPADVTSGAVVAVAEDDAAFVELPAPNAFAVSAGEGPRAVLVAVKDRAGNVAHAIATTVVDETPPTIGELDVPESVRVHYEFAIVAPTVVDAEGVTGLSWWIADHGDLSGDEIDLLFLTSGAKTGYLNVTDVAGNVASLEFTIVVVTPPPPPPAPPAPGFTFSPSVPRVGDVVVFDGTGSVSERRIVAFEWSFGDGSTATGARASHAFGSHGTYAVTLTVTDANGRSGSITRAIDVFSADGGAPVAGPVGSGGGSGDDGGADPIPVDDTPPRTLFMPLRGVLQSPRYVHFTTEPGGSTYWRIGSEGEFTLGNTVTVEGDGDVRVEFFSVDAAGNGEPVRDVTLTLDGRPPVVTDVAFSAQTAGVGATVLVEARASDASLAAVTGLVSGPGGVVEVPLVAGEDGIHRGEFVPGAIGVYDLSVRATDGGGRESTSSAVNALVVAEPLEPASEPPVSGGSPAAEAKPVPGAGVLALLAAAAAVAWVARGGRPRR